MDKLSSPQGYFCPLIQKSNPPPLGETPGFALSQAAVLSCHGQERRHQVLLTRASLALQIFHHLLGAGGGGSTTQGRGNYF